MLNNPPIIALMYILHFLFPEQSCQVDIITSLWVKETVSEISQNPIPYLPGFFQLHEIETNSNHLKWKREIISLHN